MKTNTKISIIIKYISYVFVYFKLFDGGQSQIICRMGKCLPYTLYVLGKIF